MRLTAFTDYSLRVLIYLAAQPERRVTIAEMSTVLDVKENHLTKVVHHLGRRGWVETARGKGGGLKLAKAPAAIRIGDVVRDTEGEVVPAECFEAGGSCSLFPTCSLKCVLAKAAQAFQSVLDDYTLEDVTRAPRPLESVVHFQPPAPRG